jgi:hypothetical protein
LLKKSLLEKTSNIIQSYSDKLIIYQKQKSKLESKLQSCLNDKEKIINELAKLEKMLLLQTKERKYDEENIDKKNSQLKNEIELIKQKLDKSEKRNSKLNLAYEQIKSQSNIYYQKMTELKNKNEKLKHKLNN